MQAGRLSSRPAAYLRGEARDAFETAAEMKRVDISEARGDLRHAAGVPEIPAAGSEPMRNPSSDNAYRVTPSLKIEISSYPFRSFSASFPEAVSRIRRMKSSSTGTS